MSVKRQLAEVVETLPETVSLEEAIARVYSAFKLKRERAKLISDSPYQVRPVSLGTPRLPSLDNIAEVLAYAEGEDRR